MPIQIAATQALLRILAGLPRPADSSEGSFESFHALYSSLGELVVCYLTPALLILTNRHESEKAEKAEGKEDIP